MLMAKFVTHGFSPRYAICSIVGVATLAAYLLARAAPRPLTAMGAAALCLIMYGVEIRILAADYVEQRGHLADASRVLSGSGDTQIALMDITVMHWLSFYAPRELATRVNYVADPQESVEYLKQDTVDHGLLDLRPWFPLKVVRAESFLADNPRALRLRFSRRLVLDPIPDTPAKWGRHAADRACGQESDGLLGRPCARAAPGATGSAARRPDARALHADTEVRAEPAMHAVDGPEELPATALKGWHSAGAAPLPIAATIALSENWPSFRRCAMWTI